MPRNNGRAHPPSTEALLSEDFVDEMHIDAFAHALELDESYFDHHGDASSPHLAPGTPNPGIPRIKKVSALSDFAPVNLKVKRSFYFFLTTMLSILITNTVLELRRRKQNKLDKRYDWSFLLLRWPLLFFIFLFIMAEFGLYVIIRQMVNMKEWLVAWRGQKGVLRRKLRAARTYQEWKGIAITLDEYLKFDEWKRIDEDSFYDWMLVRKVKRSLKALREKNDVRGCLGVLETCIRSNFAAVESSRLYSETFLGTKDLIEGYILELELSLAFIRETPELSIDEKKRFFKSANTNLGLSALCLSGGASFGYYHLGVVKAFLDAGLLPCVVTGTSAGGLVAALTCTYTDEELKVLLVPELANRITACEESISVWFKRFWKTGARFDSVTWARKCTFFTRGSMTFKEAYTRTGRILNISVIPADRHSPTKLLNYMTAPDTIIWSALLASAAVPGILNPVVLMQKLKDGSLVPWSWGSRFKDGSLRVDIPIQALNQYFNVTHPVVSQVNPHVHLFFFAPRGSAGKPVAHRKGKGWRGNFLLSAAEQWLKHELTKNFKVIRDLELLPQLLGQDWSSVFLQRFEGVVTIWPRTRIWDWFRILTDPDQAELGRMLRVGQVVTWPKLHMIENRARIERQILLGRQTVHEAYNNKSRSGSHEPKRILSQKVAVGLPSNPPRPISPHSGSDMPLSVDTDAEAASAQNSRLGERGRSSKHSPIQDEQDLLGSSIRRRRWASDFLNSTVDDEHLHENLNSKGHTTVSELPGFFSRLRNNSLSTMASPFSYQTEPASRRESSVDNRSGGIWSSEGSSDEEYPPQE